MKATTSQATSQAQLDWTPTSIKSASKQERDELFALVMAGSYHKSQAAIFENSAKALKAKLLRKAGAK